MTGTPAAIEIEGLWTVLGKTIVHRDVHLEVRSGEVLAIVGGSGSGKTTLLREMLGLLVPTRGRVKVLGVNMSHLQRSDRLLWSSRCGVVFQNGALFSALSAFDNVALPIRESSWWPEELLRDLVLTTLQATDIAVAEANNSLRSSPEVW